MICDSDLKTYIALNQKRNSCRRNMLLILTLSSLAGFFFIVSSLNTETYDYKEALKMSLLFFEAQRSGYLPKNNRVHWRGDSALDDRGENGEDLVGGYYDGSDFVKFGFTTAFATTMLSWGFLLYEDSYKLVEQDKICMEAIKWATDYFIKCHVKSNVIYTQVGDFEIDHYYWGRPEDMRMKRPTFKIDKNKRGCDISAEISAALAASSIVFESRNRTYAEDLLNRAKTLFEYSIKYPGFYNESYPKFGNNYHNLEYEDELAWASMWLYKATKIKKYKKYALKFYVENMAIMSNLSLWYDKKHIGILALLATEEDQNKQYVIALKNYCKNVTKYFPKTPKGLLYLNKSGTLARAAYTTFICLQSSDSNTTQPDDTIIQFAKTQIDYMLGSTGRSFVVGYGKNYPEKPLHPASSCPNPPAPCSGLQFNSKNPNPQILYGALVSGPQMNDYYEDVRYEDLFNEVSLDYNSGFQGALAGLIHHLKTKSPKNNNQ